MACWKQVPHSTRPIQLAHVYGELNIMHGEWAAYKKTETDNVEYIVRGRGGASQSSSVTEGKHLICDFVPVNPSVLS